MAAQDGGGHFGIGVTDAGLTRTLALALTLTLTLTLALPSSPNQVSDAGLVTESCVLNVCAVGADGVLRTPPSEGML